MPRSTGYPVIEQIDIDPVSAFRRLAGCDHCLFLDSSLQHEQLGRYSFVAADPFEFFAFTTGDLQSIERLDKAMRRFRARRVHDLPPFQGGAAGLFGYDLRHCFETLNRCRWDEFQLPSLAVGMYDVVLAFDHATDRGWLLSHGFPELEPNARSKRAARRICQFREWLREEPRATRICPNDFLRSDQLAPQHATPFRQQLTSDFSADEYHRAVQQTIDYIYAGAVFQVNLSQRLLHPADDDATALYLRLRERNPATFAGYFDFGAGRLISASPERFLRVHDRNVEARPIKGTRPRRSLPEVDLFAGSELLASEKDRAENVMIVDLLRNDLSRVCDDDSVCVEQLCQLEVYEFVQHLVSSVTGRLSDPFGPLDLLASSFPGGSITGAPKIRAMEIITELEPTSRGPYCGSLGYVGFDGSMDLSILIRTVTESRGWWQLPVGGGIVAQSSPKLEYEETWHKAEGMIRALE